MEYAVKRLYCRYQRGGAKPDWILEIQAAKESTSGAIGSHWAANQDNDNGHVIQEEEPEVASSHVTYEESTYHVE